MVRKRNLARIRIQKIRHHQQIKSIRRRADSGEDIVGRVDVVTTGAGTALRKKVVTRITPLFATVWKVATRTVSDFYEEQQVKV